MPFNGTADTSVRGTTTTSSRERRQSDMSTQDSHRGPSGSQEPVGDLVQRASQQLTELVRGEMRLAQAEMKEKGKRYGKGGGLFGGAGLVGFLTLQALVATAIAALAVPLPVWAAALIVTAVLGVITAVLALTGKKEVSQAAPPAPQQTIDSVKADVAEIKESAQR
ncbi:integral membrane protein [Streptomyces azureus]|uniref:Integral membrane protein n=2 Tax=Streptomyces azureus TaxID=146537 RepID=A0A0K8PRI9_STRAJ|nr:integral membrane protein [Streptomyces azureus]